MDRDLLFKLLELRYSHFHITGGDVMRYLRLVILISIFGFGLNTTVFAQICCPAGCVQDGGRCVTVCSSQRTCRSVPCAGGSSSSGGGGSGGRQTLVTPPWLGGNCVLANRTPETRAAATNQCVAVLAANANLFRCLFESNADRDEDVRTGLSCKDRQAALANQCRAPLREFCSI